MSRSAALRVAASIAGLAAVSALALSGIASAQASGEPEVSISSASVREKAGEATLIVSLDRAADRDVSVGYATADGAAMAPGDYTSASGVATIPAGATSTAIVLVIVDDTNDEPTETFTVRLSDARGAIIGTGGESATVTIVDADPGPNLDYLFAVYTVTWAAFFVYVFMMSRRQRAMRDEIEALRAAVVKSSDTD